MADTFTMNSDSNPQPAPPSTPSPQLPPQQQQPTQQQLFIGAAEAQFIAQRSRAVANLNYYLNAGTAVAEHPDTVEEIVKLIKTIDAADGYLQTLQRITQV